MKWTDCKAWVGWVMSEAGRWLVLLASCPYSITARWCEWFQKASYFSHPQLSPKSSLPGCRSMLTQPVHVADQKCPLNWPQPMMDGNWLIILFWWDNWTYLSPSANSSRWDEAPFAHSGNLLINTPCLPFFPSVSLLHSSVVAFRNHITNGLHSNLCIRICFWGNPI